jgi:hypothetical protein
LEVRRELCQPNAKRVAMARVGALVFKRCLNRSIVERLRKVQGKYDRWP